VTERKDSFHIPLPFDTALSGLLKVNPHPMIEQKPVKKPAAKKRKSAVRRTTLDVGLSNPPFQIDS
jgi:hypothetical protein